MHTYFLNQHIYTDGRAEALSLYGQAFKYADGLFETIRIHEGKPLFLSQHFNRLFTGMYFLKYRFHEEKFQTLLTEAIYRLLVHSPHLHGKLRVQVFRRETTLPPEFVMEYEAIENYYATQHSLSLIDYFQIPLLAVPFAAFKTNNRLHYQMASLYAAENGYDESVLYADNKFAGETSNFNLFVVKNRKVYTSTLQTGCLNGLMRAKVLQMCADLGVVAKEKYLKKQDLLEADELFLTNIVRGIVPVWKYNDRLWETENCAMTQYLRKNWSDFINLL